MPKRRIEDSSLCAVRKCEFYKNQCCVDNSNFKVNGMAACRYHPKAVQKQEDVMRKLFSFFGRWRKRAEDLEEAVTESTEAYEHLNLFIDAVKDTIKDEEILKKLRRAKVEMIEAQHAVAKVLKGWKK